MAMTRLPFVSAMRPQMGAMTALTTKLPEKTMPDQRFTASGPTPNSVVRYRGRKGISMV